VVGNALAVPAIRRWRRERGVAGLLVRSYVDLGVATLLLGVAVALAWAVFVLPAGLIGAFGVRPELAFGAFRVASIAFVGGVAAMLLWGFTFGQARIEHTRLRIPLPGLDPALDGLRVVQISDLHIGNRLDGARLDRMVERTNALDPDVVVVTGDIFDFDPAYVEDGARRLAGLRARHGVYAILGNHDVYTGRDEVVSALARLAPEIRLLRDEIVKLPLEAPLYLAGVEDTGRDWSTRDVEWGGLETVAAARPQDGPTILLAHRPTLLEQAARHGFPLMLAGHTHGGQLALPTPGGRTNLARVMTPLTRGLYRRGATTLYVNRGLGVGGPSLRFNCRREITTVELTAGA
jgi:predicted MPP superfamily phosphohydrolase